MGDLILACCAACGRLGWRLGRAPLPATLGAGAAMLAIGAHVLWAGQGAAPGAALTDG